MSPDLTVIRRRGRYSVLAHSQPARLRDGTVVDLHLVRRDTGHHDDRFLRAVIDHPLIGSHVVDVRALAKNLDADIRRLPERDAGDLVVLTLRETFRDGAGLLTRLVETSLAKVSASDADLACAVQLTFLTGAADFLKDDGDRRFWPIRMEDSHAAA